MWEHVYELDLSVVKVIDNLFLLGFKPHFCIYNVDTKRRKIRDRIKELKLRRSVPISEGAKVEVPVCVPK